MSDIPANGTKAAVRYWAKRSRQSMRDAEWCMTRGHWAQANEYAMQAAGEASEMHTAMEALSDRHRHVNS
jgi:hypothetical protein